MVDDSRYRTKVYLDTYLSSAAITKNDDTTLASYITAYSDPQYPLKMVLFEPKNVDAIFSIEPFDTEPLIGWDKKAYAYHEQVPVTIYTVDKTGISGLKLENKCAQELRRVFEAYPTGSVRFVKRIHHDIKDMGGWNLYTATYLADYTRVQENYTPTTPTVTHTIGWTYDGDRVSGGVEGTWEEHEDGNTAAFAVNSERNLELVVSVSGGNKKYYIDHDTAATGVALGLSSDTYTKIRWRYKTSSTSVKAKIVLVFSDASTQTVLDNSSSTTFTVGSATVTAAKTINYVQLHANSATGTVTYDFVQIYAGDYIMPNCVKISYPFMLNNAKLDMPNYSGSYKQTFGSKGLEFRTTHDLDMQPWTGANTDNSLSWKRPQTTGASKTDYNNMDIFLETVHKLGCDAQYPWVWLKLGTPAVQFKAQLIEMRSTIENGRDALECTWEEQRTGSASNESTVERFGLSLS